MSGLNPVTSEIAVYCCYFEIKYETNVQLETYIQEVDEAGHVSGDCMYIIIAFLFESIFNTMIICVRRCIQPIASMRFLVFWHHHHIC